LQFSPIEKSESGFPAARFLKCIDSFQQFLVSIHRAFLPFRCLPRQVFAAGLLRFSGVQAA
jgi:hypothetical protein